MEAFRRLRLEAFRRLRLTSLIVPICFMPYNFFDQIGVPRDMSYPAARQFRAHLNWAIDILKN